MIELFSRFVLSCIACLIIASLWHAVRRAWRERANRARYGNDGGTVATGGDVGGDCGGGGGGGGGD